MKNKTKKILILVLLVAITAAGTVLYFQYKNRKDSLESLEKSLVLEFNNLEGDTVVVEYQKEPISKCDIISKGKELLAEDECFQKLTANEAGEYNATYLLKAKDNYNQEITKEISQRVIVKDTVFPIITLKADEVKLKAKDTYKLEENILEVLDPVDGQLKYQEGVEVPEKGKYGIYSEYKQDVPGRYEVLVLAIDKSGNESRKTFVVEVPTPIVTPVTPTEETEEAQPGTPTTSTDSIFTVESGDFGAIKVGDYQAALYGDARYYDTSLDHYIDAENAAPVYLLPSGALYIPDHNYQGFSETMNCDTLYLADANGNVKEFHKVEQHLCKSSNSGWIAYDGFDVWYTYRGRLVTQTCVDDDNIVFVIWD